MNMSAPLPRLNLLVLRSLNLSAAVGFYQLLGLRFGTEKHGSGPEHWSSQVEGLVLEIYPARSDADVDRTTRLGFEVQELGQLESTLRSAGYRIAQEAKASPWGLRSVVVDPDGRSVELLQVEMGR